MAILPEAAAYGKLRRYPFDRVDLPNQSNVPPPVGFSKERP
jgi:hypothetical protein